MPAPAPPARTPDRGFAAALAGLAAARVLLFACAFPFFGNVDEHKHVDMVLKYARGALPGAGGDAFEPEMGTLLGLYGSPEYLLRPGEALAPPGFALSGAARERRVAGNEAFLAARANKEVHQPPVYYALAGAWLALGRGLGLGGGASLYWLRALDALLLAGLVLVAHALLRRSHPESPFLRRGVPLLLALFPQDALYSVSPDALSPLLGAGVFAGACALARRAGRGAGEEAAPAALWAAAGLAGAAAFLTKYTNLALLAALLPAALLARRRAGAWRGPLLLALALAVPVALWLLRNQLLLGDFTGNAGKVERLGWERRPLGEWLAHPLFTPTGLASFAGQLGASFWRGELAWQRAVLRWPAADAVYVASSLVLPLLAGLGLRGRDRAGEGAAISRRAEALAGAALLAAVALLAALSLPFSFPERTSPSAGNPYFSQGRLISGVLLPFALLYARGIEVAAARLPARARSPAAWLALGAVCGLALGSELWLARGAFASPYNAFGLY